ncbi:cation-translocating P-type ATPase [Inquilinus sp.]|uniref:cation-translocating P-type ATPase n=1 Tax=Inquilinus sp. TaxID=1932117 RepID=UPI0031D0F206
MSTAEDIATEGLTTAEARVRLDADGPNALPPARRRTLLRIALEIAQEPMFLLLIVAGGLYLALGERTEAWALLSCVVVTIGLAIAQESRTERAVQALATLAMPKVEVVRSGQRRRIDSRELVRGDIFALAEGERVAADAVLVSGQDLLVDESHLTGESVPVRKRPAARRMPMGEPGGDDTPFVFSGSMIVRGGGLAEAAATGVRSRIGRIGQALTTLEPGASPLARQTRRLVRLFAMGGLGLSVLAALLYGAFRGGWIEAALAGITLAMAMLPEEFPMVLTVFLVMGAWRIARIRVLTRRAPAIETLGAATVLCTDKTGTLTLNRMSVSELRTGEQAFRPREDGEEDLPEALRPVLDVAALASDRHPFDPMEQALRRAEDRHLPQAAAEHEGWQLVHHYGLRPDLLAVTRVWRIPGEPADLVASKGAPETILRLCRAEPSTAACIRREVEAMAARGMRVLGVARARSADADLPPTPEAFRFEFVGLVGLADPIRQGVPEAIAECRRAGIKVAMITGDHPVTAQAIAREAGFDKTAGVMTGDMIGDLSDADLADRIGSTGIFARIMPEQKLRLVQAFKARGEIVAMTGDGVNDAPALKAAHIGIAMGGRGTDVAREAAAIVLLDDDFGAIVRAIRLGRRIYDNLRKAMGFVLAVHIPIAGLSLLPLLFGWPIVLEPLHIAFLELVIDPVCALVFESEAEEDDVMARPPWPVGAPLLSRDLLAWGVLDGVTALLLVGTIYGIGLFNGLPESDLRALTFASLVLANFGLILVNRSFSASLGSLLRPNTAFGWVLGVTIAMLGLAVYLPVARELFDFGTLHLDDLALVAGAGLVTILALQLAKSTRWLDLKR